MRKKKRALETKPFQKAIEAELDRVAAIHEPGRPRKILRP
jgi:hypothetical protein